MFNIKKTVTDLFGLVGFEQTKDANIPALDADLLTSRSGKVFTKGTHELVSLENLYLTAPDFSRYDTALTKETLFSDHLKDMASTAITNVLHGVVNKKKLHELTKDTLTQTNLFEGVGRLSDKIIKQGRFLGFLLETKEGRLGVLPIIRKIMLQVSEQNPNLNFYIYHPEQSTPLATIPAGSWAVSNSFNTVKVNQLENTLLDTAFESYDKLIVGYYEDDLTGQAINKEWQCNKAPCGGCNPANKTMYWAWANNIHLHPFEVQAEDLDTVAQTQFSATAMQFKYNTNWGMNLEIAINCDLSEFIIQNQNSLIDAISLQFAVQGLEQLLYNTRENKVSEQTRSLALTGLNGTEGSPGLYKKADQAIENLSFDFSNFNSPCLPCNNKSGVKIKSVF